MIGGRSRRKVCVGAAAKIRIGLIEPLTETLQPRRECSFVGRLRATIAPLARAAGHRPHPRSRGNTELFAAPKNRADHTAPLLPCQEFDNFFKLLDSLQNSCWRCCTAGPPHRPFCALRQHLSAVQARQPWRCRKNPPVSLCEAFFGRGAMRRMIVVMVLAAAVGPVAFA